MKKGASNLKIAEDICILAKEIQRLNQQAYDLYILEVDDLIRTRTRDNAKIERLLDGILSFCGDDQVLVLFKKLCRYYWNINPQGTADYVRFYREIYDSDEEDSYDSSKFE